uniref:Fis family transcriptional regulator n=1 Tax=Thermogemmatispora argillosa TaxID=2045280 RepID=A0A455T082_9CHLR|nr:Fis family transcriptional regulator [Thermogemmatispora argillosa]
MHRLITRDPVSGGELIVTRLECPESGVVIEGRFSLGWIGRLTPEQLDFVERLVKNRGNIQKLANELDIAYNTARSRLDEIVAALGGPPESEPRPSVDRRAILDRLAAREITVEEAMRLLRGQSDGGSR